jgi:hypothetical protein
MWRRRASSRRFLAHARYVRARTYWRGGPVFARIWAAVVARCAARLRDGQPCGRTGLRDSQFCSHHTSLVEMHEADVLKQRLPSRRASSGSKPPKVVTAHGPIVEDASGSQDGSPDPATVRPRLGEAAGRLESRTPSVSTATPRGCLCSARRRSSSTWCATARFRRSRRRYQRARHPDRRLRNWTHLPLSRTSQRWSAAWPRRLTETTPPRMASSVLWHESIVLHERP